MSYFSRDTEREGRLQTWGRRLGEVLALLKKRDARSLLFKALIRAGVRNFGVMRLLSPLPVELMIEPVNACNLKCPTCPTGSGKLNRPPRAMTLPEFRKIIDEVRGRVCRIFLWNFGEPFLNPDLLGMVSCAAAAGIDVRLSTNGGFLRTPEFCRAVVQSGLEHMIVSLDGADQATHCRFRRGSDFSAVTEGVRNLVAARAALRSAFPLIELQFLVMRHNEGQRGRMRRLADELGVDTYSEKSVGVDICDPSQEALARELVPSDLSLSIYSSSPGGRLVLKGAPRKNCPRLYSTAVINSDGSVVPCCYDLYSSHVMGNVFERPLAEIWAGEKYRRLRRLAARDKSALPMCAICMEGRPNLYLWRRRKPKGVPA